PPAPAASRPRWKPVRWCGCRCSSARTRSSRSTPAAANTSRGSSNRMTDIARQACDLIIEAGWVVPVIPHGVVLEDHAVVVSGGAIVSVLPTAEARTRFSAKETVSRPDAALIPGLVNAHTHNPMTLLRGVADARPLKVWLQQHIWPIE